MFLGLLFSHPENKNLTSSSGLQTRLKGSFQRVRAHTNEPIMPQKPLRVAVIGPKGMCGKPVVNEMLLRGHSVVYASHVFFSADRMLMYYSGISRTPSAKWDTPGDYSSIAADVNDVKKMTEIFSSGFDAIVCAYGTYLWSSEFGCLIRRAESRRRGLRADEPHVLSA